MFCLQAQHIENVKEMTCRLCVLLTVTTHRECDGDYRLHALFIVTMLTGCDGDDMEAACSVYRYNTYRT